jgi:hypothetical protein
MKKLTALMAAAALLGSTTLAPAVYAPMKSGLSGDIVLAQMSKDKDKTRPEEQPGKPGEKDKKDKVKPKPKAKEKKSKDKDKA